ncbi:DUF3472 domain-containing protein [Roseiconus lacunae]|uniref:DUF3472 domain-containing protein n=1 Tax=Roseiconus lacunae TaxID=2605694 RepID=UPI0011F2A659|nr:DUF3472 domain-containing protein [Roseiconus lacunae]
MRLMTSLCFLCLASVGGIPSLAIADDPCKQLSPEEMAQNLGVDLPRRPWHVANIWWHFEDSIKNFESLEMEITIDRDIPDSYNLYVSPCGSALINGLQFYGGIQTNINGWISESERTRVHRGHGVIFSRWSSDKKTPIGLEHVRTAGDDCLVESAGYEGEFASVRRPFRWKKGTYTWSITKADTMEQNDAASTWFTCRLKDQTSGEVLEVGSLLFEGEQFEFWNRHSAFVEVYSTAKIPRSDIPKVKVKFGWPRINGEKVKLSRTSAFYPDKAAGTTSSPDCAKIHAEGEACVIEVGALFKRDPQQRRHAIELVPEQAN